jgi:hypothetical protein
MRSLKIGDVCAVVIDGEINGKTPRRQKPVAARGVAASGKNLS